MASDSQIDKIRRKHNIEPLFAFYREISRSLNISRLGRIEFTQPRDCDRFQVSNKIRDDFVKI